MPTCSNCGRESPEDFTFCLACGHPLAPAPGREVRKTVTVVFCDVTSWARPTSGRKRSLVDPASTSHPPDGARPAGAITLPR